MTDHNASLELDKGQKLLQQLVHFRTYAATKSDGFKETVTESIMRTEQMHLDKFPALADDINKAFDQVYAGRAVPSMRALDDETLIPTPRGFKLIKDIVVGDEIFDRQGNITKVLKLHKFTDIPLYELQFSDYSKLTACAEHLWHIRTNDDLRNGKERVETTQFISEHLYQSERPNIRIKNTEAVQYPKQELAVDPYILGLWLGNGYSSGTQWASDVNDAKNWTCAAYEKAGYEVWKAGTKNIYAWNVADLKADLLKYDLIKNKHIPDIYLISSIEQRYDLLAGLIDTDGCVCSDTGRILFSNCNYRLIEGIKQLINSLGFTYTDTCRLAHDNSQDNWNVSFFGNKQCSKMPRKRNKITERTSIRTHYRRVTALTFLKNGNATCFEVDSADHSFLAGVNYIPTHNCLQFSGPAIHKENVRSFNCSAHKVENYKTIADFFYISMCGSGIGFSIQKMHIKHLPVVVYGDSSETFTIPDSKDGWADSLLKLLENPRIQFDYSLIRPNGTKLSSGGTASGPQALQIMHGKVRLILIKAFNRQLKPIEIHDTICHMLDAVVVGGSRRSSSISLFDADDEDMLTSKTGNWFDNNPQRARANNSAVLYRDDPKLKQKFDLVFDRLVQSGYGEPGFLLSNSRDLLVNPCMSLEYTHLLKKFGDNDFRITKLRDVHIGDEIWSGFNWTKVTAKWKTGNKKLYKYITEHNYFIGTDNHRVMSEGYKVEVKDAKTLDIVKGPYDSTFNFDNSLMVYHSRELAEEFQEEISSKGIVTSIVPVESGFELKTADCYNFNNKIISITELPEEDVYDITVDDPSHCFWCSGAHVSNCNEARLKSFCNLSEINVAACKTPKEFMEAVHAATVIGSLQASYTNFNYIAPDWKEKCEEEALLGVSLTGQALNWNLLTKEGLLKTASESLLSTNEMMARKLGINLAHRIGLVKPSGTTSAWLGVTSGIHAAYAPHYFRRVRIDVSHPIAQYLLSIYKLGEPDSRSFLEYDKFNSSNVIVTIPMKSHAGSIQREKESAIELLERDKFVYNNWIKPSHRIGEDTHNISITVEYRQEELEDIRKWMWENRDSYAGISLFPKDDNKYSQTPFESISKGIYYRKYSELADLDFSTLNFHNVLDERLGEAACGGNSCEFK